MVKSRSQELDQLLDAAEECFYERGFRAVGMDALREESGLPLKRIYGLLPSKAAIAVEMLERRDEKWMAALRSSIEVGESPVEKVLAIFDWLEIWLAHEGHRGCAWINAYGEMGGTSTEIAAAVRDHKARLRELVSNLVSDAGGSPSAADAIFLLVEGCMVTAGINGTAEAAAQAKSAAQKLLLL